MTMFISVDSILSRSVSIGIGGLAGRIRWIVMTYYVAVWGRGGSWAE
jgi:hypothetical protein